MEAPNFILYEHSTGYALFRIDGYEDIGKLLPQVEWQSIQKGKFQSQVKLASFLPFRSAANALENCNAISEGILHPDLSNFLETNLPKKKKSKTVLGVGDPRIGQAIVETFAYLQCVHVGPVQELLRGIRLFFSSLAQNLNETEEAKAQLGLGHSYSRAKVKFNVHRVDNMIIQAIALLDQLDKDINTFSMRIREWYSYHFPELYKVVPDQYTYCRCARYIKDRKNLSPDQIDDLKEIVVDEEKVNEIFEAARSSMGMDISPIDLMNIERFTDRVVSLTDYRRELQEYLKDRMHSCAPNLAVLIGEQVGARLISKAGSLTNLAKYPASTIQILGAEKALFRALKTRGATPKYGLLFHSTFIGRAAAKNKGRISRYLANKCAIASRIDCFSDVPVEAFGQHLKQQVEDRLKFFESGEFPKKNLEVMKEAMVDAMAQEAKALKKRKKMLKKEKKTKEESVETQVHNVKQEMIDEEAIKIEHEEKLTKKSEKKKLKKLQEAESTVEHETTDNGIEQNEKPRKRKKMTSESLASERDTPKSPTVKKQKKKLKGEKLTNGSLV